MLPVFLPKEAKDRKKESSFPSVISFSFSLSLSIPFFCPLRYHNF
jgi:hypothetical protein